MASRIAHMVEKGVIDNTIEGKVRGIIHLVGYPEPIALQLKGNCLADLSGRRCWFSNPNPFRDRRYEGLAAKQEGIVGDMTASRKVRIPDVPLETYFRMRDEGEEPPSHWGNSLYVEWYSNANGRVVIESSHFEVHLSLPEWTMDEDDERKQASANLDAFGTWLDHLQAAMDDQRVEVPEDRAMDEFEWEKFMREADARGERYGELLDKYRDHPDKDRIIAREMGWVRLGDSPSDAEDDDNEWDDITDEMFDEDLCDPDPERENVDWVKDESGHICHPLVKRADDVSLEMWRTAQEAQLYGRGVPREKVDDDVEEMVVEAQLAAAKLAGALNGIAQGMIPLEPGFIVASLKRAFRPLTGSLNALQRVEERGLLQDCIASFRERLFEVRSGLLELQEAYRREIREEDADS